MNYRKDLEKAKEYIENNLQNQLTLAHIAQHVGYSVFHLSRIFYHVYQETVMDYVRGRRLKRAIYEMRKGKSITEAAFNYGFSSASGFSKAFKKNVGVTPSTYLKTDLVEQMNVIESKKIIGKEDLNKMVRFQWRPEFHVLGFTTEQISRQDAYTFDYVANWDNVTHDEPEAYLYQKLNPKTHGEIGIFIHDETGGGEYLIGLPVENYDLAEEKMTRVFIPESLYAVFTTIPTDELTSPGSFANTIRQTWQSIFLNWFENSVFEYDATKQDFEWYDERCHWDTDAVMEIWIPVKEIGS